MINPSIYKIARIIHQKTKERKTARYTDIKKESEFSPRTIYKALKFLEENGWIKKEQRRYLFLRNFKGFLIWIISLGYFKIKTNRESSGFTEDFLYYIESEAKIILKDIEENEKRQEEVRQREIEAQRKELKKRRSPRLFFSDPDLINSLKSWSNSKIVKYAKEINRLLKEKKFKKAKKIYNKLEKEYDEIFGI